MAEKIVILGNGFDLRHFLPTKYNHLITILREIENYDFSESEVSFSDLFNGSFKEKDEFFYNGILNYYDVQNIKFNSEKLKSIQDRLEMNNWFQYLKTVEDSKIETWIDFETEINRVLLLINNFFLSYEKLDKDYQFVHYSNYNTEQSYYFIQNHLYRRTFNNKLQYNILLNFYLLFSEERVTTLNEDFVLIIGNEIQYFKEKEFFESIYESLEEFVGIFNDYILYIVNVFYNNFIEEKKENFICIGDKFLFDKVLKIFSFNYTNTFNRLYRIKDDKENNLRKLKNINLIKEEQNFKGIDFLHGFEKEDWKIFSNDNKLEKYSYNNLKMVLGVDEIDNSLKENKLYQFTKYFQKLHKKTDFLFIDDYFNVPAQKYLQELYFYFWGHSLDISDKNYIKDVFEYLNDSNTSKIFIFYHTISSKAELLKNLLNIIDKLTIEKFIKYNRLVFLESKPENLFNELA